MTAAQRATRFPADEPLEDTAIAATSALKDRLPAIQRCWTSPAQGARDTAGLLGVAAVTEPLLADNDYGRWKGRSMAEIADREPKAIAWR